GGAIGTVAGPAAGLTNDLIMLSQEVAHGDKDPADAGANLLRIATQNTPYINLFYTRMALDYLLLYQVQEALNPGYLRRMERRINKENNPTSLLSPRRDSSLLGF